MLKAIIFDIGEVYINGVKGAQFPLAKILKRTPKEIEIAMHQNNWTQFKLGEISENKYLDNIIKELKISLRFKNIIKKTLRNQFVLIEDTQKIVKKLKGKYILGVISNHAKEWINYCKKHYEIDGLFDSILWSYDIGLAKPDPKIFKLMLKRLNLKARECLFIDDQENNIKTAKKLGFKTILFENPRQLKKELKKMEIKGLV